MDTVVTPAGTDTWTLEDRLSRPLGTVSLMGSGKFSIKADAGKLFGISTGPFDTLDRAMAAIEELTKGACQLSTDG